jgi:glycosyltransferase involved in cell wall biosynthesis
MHIFLNASAANAGGGLTYLRNVIPHLSAWTNLSTTVLATRGAFGDLGSYPGIKFLEAEAMGNTASRRFWREQWELPGLLRRSGCEVLISAGNMALFRSPIPQVLLTRNALYTSSDFYTDLWKRKDLGLWLDTRVRSWFAKRSILKADCVVAPSEAFANEIRRWTGKKQLPVSWIHHGFDPHGFFESDDPLPEALGKDISQGNPSLRILFVSHYNYFRNFETLVRAIPLIKRRLPGINIRMVLTCRLHPSSQWGPYDAIRIENLVRELGVTNDILELDLMPYRSLHKVYRSCDIYVSPAYAESFAHPLVEAMACGLPVIASDLSVHREVCGDAARYFPRFSHESLADRVVEIAGSRTLALNMSARGLLRSRSFSWKEHVCRLITLAAQLVDGHRTKKLPLLSPECTLSRTQ